jgi:23S rRNA (pseudouridine1915-N3)-methyltransferase
LIVRIIVTGKTRDVHLHALENDFLARLRHYTRVDLIVVREPKPADRAGARRDEGTRLLQKIQTGDFVVALDSRGKELTSRGLSAFLQKHLLAGTKRMAFIIGGPEGLDSSVTGRADLVLSFSRFTLTHEMIRPLLLEQLYRAWTLLRGERYHR